jgi:hypothetical protein
MKNAIKMGSGAVMYIPSFRTIRPSSGIQKLLRGIHRHADKKAIS